MPTQHEERRSEVRRATDFAQETTNALTAREFEGLHEEMAELRAEIAALKADRDKAMKWGIGVLGAAVLALASWIVNAITSGKLRL